MLLKVDLAKTPYVEDADRIAINQVCKGFYTGTARFGFMENPCIGAILPDALPFSWDDAVFMLPRPIPTDRGSIGRRFLQHSYLFLSKTGLSPVEWFDIPPHQAIAIGLELEM